MIKAMMVAAGLALAAGGAAAAAEPAGDAAKGASVFADRCSLCHEAGGGGQGPSLTTVYGRKAGSLAGFTFTDALKGSGLTWTAANLDRFLSGPEKMVPGTAMALSVEDPADRRDLVAYLAGGKR